MNKIIEGWFHKYSDALFSWAYHKTSSREASEDLVQDTFLAAVRAYDGFQNNSNPKTWLFAILNNKIIDFYRKKAKSFALNSSKAEQMFINQTDSFFDSDQNWTLKKDTLLWEEEHHILDNEDFRKTLNTCMKALPENWRLAMLSKYILNKTANEICQEIKITQSNYWQIVHRSKLLLRNCIESNWKN